MLRATGLAEAPADSASQKPDHRLTGVKGVGDMTNSPLRVDCSLLSLLMVTDLTPPLWRSTEMTYLRLQRAIPLSTVVPLVTLFSFLEAASGNKLAEQVL